MERHASQQVVKSLLLFWLIYCVSPANVYTQVDTLRGSEQSNNDEASPGWRSPFLAFAMSAVATGVPVTLGFLNTDPQQETLSGVLVLGGLTLGPAIGYFYGGLWGRGLMWAGVRAGIIGVTLLTMGATASSGGLESFGAVYAIGIIGLVAVGVDALYDIFAVGSYVSDRNIERRVFGMRVTPVFSVTTKTIGVRVSIRL